jgi:hypothetical protein
MQEILEAQAGRKACPPRDMDGSIGQVTVRLSSSELLAVPALDSLKMARFHFNRGDFLAMTPEPP